MSRKTNEQLETRYVTGRRISLKALAAWGGVSVVTAETLSKKGAWVRKRREFLGRVTDKAATKRSEHVAQDLAKFQGRAFEIAASLMERIAQHTITEDPETKVDPDTLRKLTGSLKDALQAGNLANGEPTDVLKTIDEQLTQLEKDLEDGLDGAV